MARIRLGKPTFTRKASPPSAVRKARSARKTVKNADTWTWWSWIGNALYAVLYYGTTVVAATVVYGTRATKAAAPQVGRAARWTGRNSVAGLQKLQNRIRRQKAQQHQSSGRPQRRQIDPAERADEIVHEETPEQYEARKDREFRWKIQQVTEIAAQKQQQRQQAGASRHTAASASPATPSTTVPSPRAAGSGSSTTTRPSGGHDMSKNNGNGDGGNGNELFRRIKQAFRPVTQLEPETAWELDFHFQAFADLLLFEAEGFSIYGETLDRGVGIDPRITRQYLEAVEDVTSAVQKLHRVRRAYREMYKAAFEAAESGRVRMPTKPAFWSPTGARK